MNASDGTNPNEINSDPSRQNNQRKGKGRRKVTMEKIEKEENLQVTFSKRRVGLFKKASELSTLCGAESAVVVFSPGKKPYSFGNPSVETIANRFLNTNIGPTPPTNPLLAAHQEASNRQLNQELIHKEGLLLHERQRKRELDMFQPLINELTYEQLNQLQEDVLGFKSLFKSRLQEATSSRCPTNVQWPNPEKQCGPSVGFTNEGGFDMTSYPNSSDLTYWARGSTSSYPAPYDQNIGYMTQYPYGAGGSTHDAGSSGGAGGLSCAGGYNVSIPYNFNNLGDNALFRNTMFATSNTEVEDETQANVSNKFQGRGPRPNNVRGGHS
ncbi:hypothetical protein ACS0TY_031006 [Phlomoides rotata]